MAKKKTDKEKDDKNKINFSREKFLSALKMVSAATDKASDVLQGTDAFIFSKGYVRSYNNQMAFTFPLDLDLSCTVRAAETQKVLERMIGMNIVLSQTEDSLFITDGKTKLSMRFLAEDEDIRSTLENMELDKVEWKPLPEDFMEGLKLCSISISDDDSFDMIGGVAISDNEIWSSDNLRVTQYVIDSSFGESFTIPKDAVNILKKMDNVKEWGRTPSGWVCFKNEDGVIFSTSELFEEFPLESFKEIFEGLSGIETSCEFPEELEKYLDVAGVMSASHDQLEIPMVTLRKEKKKLIIEGKKDFGSVDSEVDFEGEFLEGNLYVSPDFLKTILSVTRKFGVDEEGKTLVFRTDNLMHIVRAVVE